MNRKKAIKKAVELLTAPTATAEDKRQCTEKIELSLSKIDFIGENRGWARRPATRAELRKLIQSIHQAKSSINKLLPLFDTDFKIDRIDADLEKLAAAARKYLNYPPKPKHRSSHRQKLAVSTAASFLEEYGHKLATTKHGKWDRLAVILNGGDPSRSSLKKHLLRFNSLKKRLLRFARSRTK